MRDGSQPATLTVSPDQHRTPANTVRGLLVSLTLPLLVGMAVLATAAPFVVAAGLLGLFCGALVTLVALRRRERATGRATTATETPR